jgi:8-oxo-dGTP diphosphatase
MDKKNHGLVIGRFQLVGNHHADLFEQIVEYHESVKKLDGLTVGIGTAEKVDFRNPFTYTGCWQMLKPIAIAAARRMEVPLRHCVIEDINNPPNYAQHVEDIIGKSPDSENQIVLFSNNDFTTNCFEFRGGYVIPTIEERIDQHASQLRDMYVSGKDITDLVPEHVSEFLEKIDAGKFLTKLKYDNPTPTVDIIIEYQGKIVIIERAEEPIGYALPGGHEEIGASTLETAKDEAEEETGLKISDLRLIGVYSDPDRDPREHKISIVYAAKGEGELVAGSDAKRVHLYDADKTPDLLFDHNKMVLDYLKMKGQ